MKKTADQMMLGAHMSIAGGVDQAIDRGEAAGCAAIQIFTKNNNQWTGKPLGEDEIAQFKLRWEESGIGPIVSHDCYLINLAGPDETKWNKSIEAFRDELFRAEQLGIPYLVMHPGSHMKTGEEVGIARLVEALNMLLEENPEGKVQVLLETTAGQGTNLGHRFEELAEMRRLINLKERVAVCLDTCHVFAAGYKMGTEQECQATMAEFDRVIGLDQLKVFHFNDSKKECASRVDRHDHIGKGHVGLPIFRYLMNDPRFDNIPKLLETPKSKDGHEDQENMAVLRGLVE